MKSHRNNPPSPIAYEQESVMRRHRSQVRASLVAVVIGLGLLPATAQADGSGGGTRVRWERIVGIVVPEGVVGGEVVGTPAPWTVTAGGAEVNLQDGQLQFVVRGLVLADDPSFTNLGTRGLVTGVKGTLVCNDTAPGLPELVDSETVTLSLQGNAVFRGDVFLPPSCVDEPEDMVFLIRIAEGEPSFLIDRWNAFGAVRIVMDP
jgi:hypothetical protein